MVLKFTIIVDDIRYAICFFTFELIKSILTISLNIKEKRATSKLEFTSILFKFRMKDNFGAHFIKGPNDHEIEKICNGKTIQHDCCKRS